MAPGRTKVAPCDMAEVGVVGFIRVPVIVIKWLRALRWSRTAAAGVRQHNTDSKHDEAVRSEESCRRWRSLGGSSARAPGVLDCHVRAASWRSRWDRPGQAGNARWARHVYGRGRGRGRVPP